MNWDLIQGSWKQHRFKRVIIRRHRHHRTDSLTAFSEFDSNGGFKS